MTIWQQGRTGHLEQSDFLCGLVDPRVDSESGDNDPNGELSRRGL